MARLLELPNEILLDITGYLSYQELGILTLTDQQLKALVYPEVKVACQKYWRVHTADRHTGHMNACDLLAESLRRGAGTLTDELTLEDAFVEHEDKCDAAVAGSHKACFRSVKIEIYGSGDGTTPIPRVRELCQMISTGVPAEDLCMGVCLGDTQVTILLTFPLMTHLRILHLSLSTIAPADHEWDGELRHFVCKMAKAASLDPNGYYPLQSLEIVFFEMDERDYNEQRILYGCAPFLALPGVRRAVIDNSQTALDVGFTWPPDLPRSRVRAIFIDDGVLDEEAGKGLISGFEGPCDIFQRRGPWWEGDPYLPMKPWCHVGKSVAGEQYNMEMGVTNEFPLWALKEYGADLNRYYHGPLKEDMPVGSDASSDSDKGRPEERHCRTRGAL